MTASCIVTGGAGFIGSHLAEQLLAQGNKVKVIDNLATGQASNLELLSQYRGFEFLEADVADFARIAGHFSGVDQVFHLAGLADIVPSIQEPLDYLHANCDGTISVAEASRLAGVKRFVYAASSSCYGLAETFPTPEEAPIRPMYPYAFSKNLGEQAALHWCQVYGLPVVSLRLFNVYGPRSRTSGAYGAVFGVFLRQKLAGSPFTVVGDGTQSRDFTFVTDVARAFRAAADSKESGVIFNVGSGHHYTINYLVELLGGEVTHIPKRPGEPDITFADTGKITSRLGWEPQVSFEDGVKQMLDHIESWQEAPLWTPDSIAHATQDWFKHLGAET